jgi:hypothetical protein
MQNHDVQMAAYVVPTNTTKGTTEFATSTTIWGWINGCMSKIRHSLTFELAARTRHFNNLQYSFICNKTQYLNNGSFYAACWALFILALIQLG